MIPLKKSLCVFFVIVSHCAIIFATLDSAVLMNREPAFWQNSHDVSIFIFANQELAPFGNANRKCSPVAYNSHSQGHEPCSMFLIGGFGYPDCNNVARVFGKLRPINDDVIELLHLCSAPSYNFSGYFRY